MPYDLSRLRVDIVDANAFSRRLLRSLLDAIGVRDSGIRDMPDAETALADMKSSKPDLILCEASLPGMDGVGFIRAVRQMEEKGRCYIPIIVCTAHVDKRRLMACRDAGAHEVLLKPLSVTALYRRIVSVIENPRPFIHASVFTGPDRRRKEKAPPGSGRRSADPSR